MIIFGQKFNTENDSFSAFSQIKNQIMIDSKIYQLLVILIGIILT